MSLQLLLEVVAPMQDFKRLAYHTVLAKGCKYGFTLSLSLQQDEVALRD
jgi:hypothetical protein